MRLTFKPESTNIQEVSHDGKALRVTFKSGNVYTYENVPVEQFHALRKADSAGTYFASHIKGKFKHTKDEK